MLHEKALSIALSGPNKEGSSARWLGRWKNQMGSTMDLAVSGNDITGSYTTATSGLGDGGQLTGALKGYAAGDLISFVVLWPGGSLTAWTGQLINDDSAPVIRTLWHLVTDVPDAAEPKQLWTSTFSGADEFSR